MKLIKKCPFFILLLSTGLLFTIIGLGGLKNIYAAQEYDPVKSPVLSVMFTAINEDIYPWQIFTGKDVVMAVNDVEEEAAEEAGDLADKDIGGKADLGSGTVKMETINAVGDAASNAINDAKSDTISIALEDTVSSAIEAAENAKKVSAELSAERLAPLRESTKEEYLNHISADIYGDAGVKRAAEYEFTSVDESYFDDALFIGDSRTVGLRDYTSLSEHADFYCETSLTIYKVLGEEFKGLGTVEEALVNNTYGKIYIMVGVNELGRGTTEDFMAEYTRVVDRLHELEPDAKIFIQGIMRVTGKKHNSDAIFNNNNINARNNAIATLADNNQFFYIDVNEAVCDEEGNLNAEYTYDQIHLLGMYNDLWKEFLMTRGVQ
ncbi:MAG: GDSL-type esterase/lipase family protein [Clostridium sp.]|nr:GDSL-type esterase/lipase family protein [Clostridium sp.]